MSTPIHRIIAQNDKSDFFHSSAYAKSQNQTGIGAASSQSFNARRSLDGNRQFIGGYHQSQITSTGNTYNRAKAYDPAAARTATPVSPRATTPGPRAANPSGLRTAPQGTSRPPLPKNPGIHR